MSATLHPKSPHWQWSCSLCKQDHALRTCQKFLNANADERYDVVVMHRYCINCLARSHLVQECRNEFGCRVCTRRHNTLLHDAPQLQKPKESKQPPKKPPTVKTQMTQTIKNDPHSWPNVFVPTATIKIASKERSDNWTMIRTLLNQSSTTTKIASSTTKRVNLSHIKHQGHDFAVVYMRARNTKGKFNKRILALITDDLPRRPYVSPINDNPYEEFCEDTLADMDPRSNTILEMELGADVYQDIRRDGAIELEMGGVVAQKTSLGYTFVGPTRKLY